MRKQIILSLILLMGFMAHAQNGSPVVSGVQIYDLGGGTGLIQVRLSGNNLHLVTAVPVYISGDAIAGGTAGVQTSGGKVIASSDVNTKILTGTFSINEASTDKMVTVSSNLYGKRKKEKSLLGYYGLWRSERIENPMLLEGLLDEKDFACIFQGLILSEVNHNKIILPVYLN